MKSNITQQQYSGNDLQLTEPHFDEEATLLSARPVVPLDEVRGDARSGRRLAFALAIVVAVIAGALVGALIYTQRGEKDAAAVVDTSTPPQKPAVSGDQPQSGAEGGVSEAETSSEAENVDVVSPPVVVKSDISTEPKKSPRPAYTNSGRPNNPEQDVVGDYADEREPRRAERIEARRLKREAKRETRAARRQSADDLLRIREIFEGSPRPE